MRSLLAVAPPIRGAPPILRASPEGLSRFAPARYLTLSKLLSRKGKDAPASVPEVRRARGPRLGRDRRDCAIERGVVVVGGVFGGVFAVSSSAASASASVLSSASAVSSISPSVSASVSVSVSASSSEASPSASSSAASASASSSAASGSASSSVASVSGSASASISSSLASAPSTSAGSASASSSSSSPITTAPPSSSAVAHTVGGSYNSGSGTESGWLTWPISSYTFASFPVVTQTPIPGVYQVSSPSEPPPVDNAGACVVPDFDYAWGAAYEQAEAFVAGLTVEEKVNVSTGVGWENGRCVGNIGPVAGFGGLCLEDSPLGVRDTDFNTAFPAGITVASTWNRTAMRLRGLVAMKYILKTKWASIKNRVVLFPPVSHSSDAREGVTPRAHHSLSTLSTLFTVFENCLFYLQYSTSQL
ncbi:hypothetical protein BKA93DRAFT_926660 [Sparassis latifolia]